jgi:hypothetical protein
VRAVLDDVEGAPVSADYTLPKGFAHGYASFSGVWLKSGTVIRRANGAGARSMVSVLRRNCYVPRAGLLASKWHRFSCAWSLLPQRFAEWMFGTDLRLQWRDRTGIAPDFPFQP